jgi:hypothetical protein
MSSVWIVVRGVGLVGVAGVCSSGVVAEIGSLRLVVILRRMVSQMTLVRHVGVLAAVVAVPYVWISGIWRLCTTIPYYWVPVRCRVLVLMMGRLSLKTLLHCLLHCRSDGGLEFCLERR